MSLGHCAPCATSSAVFPNPWHLSGASQSLIHQCCLANLPPNAILTDAGMAAVEQENLGGLIREKWKTCQKCCWGYSARQTYPSLLTCHDSCGCRKGLVPSTPRVGTLRVPGCSNRHWEAHCFVCGSGCNVHAARGWEMCFPSPESLRHCL